MKCCITGNAGFIGSNLTEACLKNNWEVIGVDNLSTGFDEMAEPIRYIDFPGSYSFIKLDINKTEKLDQVFSDCEVVFHLAALPRVSFSIDHPVEANHANVSGTLSVLEAARKAGVKRVVFSCSSSVYGGVAVFPTPETASPTPKSPYALHKQAGAEYCRLYSELHGLETVSLLYFNVFGPFQRTGGAYSTVIPAFFEAGINGKSCRIDGDGMQRRDFTYVLNVVQANLLAAQHSGKLMGDRFNIANGNSYSVLEVWQSVKRLLCIDLKKHHVASRLGDPFKSQADINKAKDILGYVPLVDFDAGMKLTCDYWITK